MTWCAGCGGERASALTRTGAATPRPPGLRDGVPIEVVSKLLGHADLTTTSSVYGHLTVEDARKALEQAGWFTGQEVRL
jgi:integrase